MVQSLGLPGDVRACLFDLDGVLTDTAAVHAAAWKEMFDQFLKGRAEWTGTEFVPFDQVEDYGRYVDGKPRRDGTRSFLQSRKIDLPEGSPDDEPGAETVYGLSSLKNDIVLKKIRAGGAHVYPGSKKYIAAVKDAGLRVAVVSSSANCREVLHSTGLDGFVEAVIDGNTIAERDLAGKPAPDSYLAGAEALDVRPADAAVFEDAIAGVEAGHAGSFGCVVGVDRLGEADELRAAGADVVVTDLGDLLKER